jgi:hypothetical protein
MCCNCADRDARNSYNPKVLRTERAPLSSKIGFMTLVGVMGFAEPSGPCPKCGHDHVKDPRCDRYGDGVTAICTVDGCGTRLPTKDPYPLSHGNCCSIINMCAENALEAVKRWPELDVDCEVQIIDLRGRKIVRVIDQRIPPEWKVHECSGCGFFEESALEQLAREAED